MPSTPTKGGDGENSNQSLLGESSTNTSDSSHFPPAKVLDRIANFKFEPYTPAKDNWKFYIQRFELEINLLQLNTPALESFCRDLLLKSVGSDLYRVVLEHYDPVPVSTISYTELTSFLAAHNTKPVSYIIARCAFSQCVRDPSMTIAEFVAKLRSSAPDCQFGSTLDERIRDQFIIGLKNPTMLERISELHKSPTDKLADIVSSALNIEAAQRQRAAFEAIISPSSQSDLSFHQPLATESTSQINAVRSTHPHQVKPNVNLRNMKNTFSKPAPLPNKQSNTGSTNNDQNNNSSNDKSTSSTAGENGNVNQLNPSLHYLRCGGNRHAKLSDCKAITATCRACQKVGHYDRACVSSGRAVILSSNNCVKYVSEFESPQEESYDFYYEDFSQPEPVSNEDYRHYY